MRRGVERDMTAAEQRPDQPQVVSVDGEVVGTVGSVLWKDRTGLDVITVSTAGRDVVVPVPHERLSPANPRIQIDFSSETVRTAPSLGELVARGGAAAVRHVADRYHVTLTGPPEGTPSGTVPPWLRIPATGSGEQPPQSAGTEPDRPTEVDG
jgi:hypothetical protein